MIFCQLLSRVMLSTRQSDVTLYQVRSPLEGQLGTVTSGNASSDWGVLFGYLLLSSGGTLCEPPLRSSEEVLS